MAFVNLTPRIACRATSGCRCKPHGQASWRLRRPRARRPAARAAAGCCDSGPALGTCLLLHCFTSVGVESCYARGDASRQHCPIIHSFFNDKQQHTAATRQPGFKYTPSGLNLGTSYRTSMHCPALLHPGHLFPGCPAACRGLSASHSAASAVQPVRCHTVRPSGRSGSQASSAASKGRCSQRWASEFTATTGCACEGGAAKAESGSSERRLCPLRATREVFWGCRARPAGSGPALKPQPKVDTQSRPVSQRPL